MAAPHDDLFHFVFQHTQHAAAWLGGLLPENLAQAIDLTTLTPAPEKLRGHTLRLGVADLVFSAALRTGQPLWFVVEHKAQDDAAVEAQVLRYVVHRRDRRSASMLSAPSTCRPSTCTSCSNVCCTATRTPSSAPPKNCAEKAASKAASRRCSA